VAAVGQALAAPGLGPDNPLGILVDSQEAQVLHCLAALSLGLTPAILAPPNARMDRRYYLENTRSLLDQVGFPAVVTDVAGMGLITALYLPLLFGVPCVMLHPLHWVASPATWLHAVSRHHGTVGWQPNFALRFMADRAGEADLAGLDLSSLRGLANCSEPVSF